MSNNSNQYRQQQQQQQKNSSGAASGGGGGGAAGLGVGGFGADPVYKSRKKPILGWYAHPDDSKEDMDIYMDIRIRIKS